MHSITRAVVTTIVTLFLASVALSASATIHLDYDFDTAGDVADNFDEFVLEGTVGHTLDGGLSNSGAISTPGHSKAVYTTKSLYSIGSVGSSYNFVAYMHNQGGDGYSGMGFTALSASGANTSGYPYVPIDALGVSVHGGGFVFSDGGNNYEQLWNGTLSIPEITTVVPYTSGSGTLLGDGSPTDQWYKVVFLVEIDSNGKFDTHLEVWPTDASGTELYSDASAIYEFNDRSATALLAAPAIMSYFSFSGDRVHNFDNFSINLEGGVSVIEEDAPVVLTEAATETTGTIVADGSVTDEGGSGVIERGFVYGTTSDPTLTDGVVVVSGTTGDFSGTTDVLENDTYHVRAYATNSSGTSYGADVTVEVTSGTSTGGGGDVDGGGDGDVTSSGTLAATGFDAVSIGTLGLGLLAAGVMVTRRRSTQR